MINTLHSLKLNSIKESQGCILTALADFGVRIGLLLLLVSLTLNSAWAQTSAATMAANLSLGRGINLGNALEAPSEGEWGIRLSDEYFDLIAEAGFDSVRVPIRWSAHALKSVPYTIDSSFFERVDWVLDQAHRTGLVVVINMHHYEELMHSPATHKNRFLSLWNQIATRYKSEPETVLFEILNEPQGAMNAANGGQWNNYQEEAIRTIRITNPNRPLIVGPIQYNGIDALSLLELPEDQNLILTVHYYDPFDFTHQGALWSDNPPPVGTIWHGAQATIGSGFQDWSWDTDVQKTRDGLVVKYRRQYAAFSLYSEYPMALTRLALTIKGRIDARVECETETGLIEAGQITANNSDWIDVTVNMSTCGNHVQRLHLKNLSTDTDTFSIRDAVVCSADSCEWPITTASQVVYDKLKQGMDFAVSAGRPIFLGEFGAFERADMESRIRWTRHVQTTAHRLGYSTAYWEFASRFGIYDPSNGSWRLRLLEALLP